MRGARLMATRTERVLFESTALLVFILFSQPECRFSRRALAEDASMPQEANHKQVSAPDPQLNTAMWQEKTESSAAKGEVSGAKNAPKIPGCSALGAEHTFATCKGDWEDKLSVSAGAPPCVCALRRQTLAARHRRAC